MPSDSRKREAWQHWQDADPEMLEPFYSKWVGLLTSEGLHAKADIATVLALLDQRIHKMEAAPVSESAPANDDLLREFYAQVNAIHGDDACDGRTLEKVRLRLGERARSG